LGLFFDFSAFYIVLFVSLGQINNLPSDPLESVYDSRTTPAADEGRLHVEHKQRIEGKRPRARKMYLK